VYTLHRRHEPGLERRTSASALILQAEHSGTHIDALCHQAEDLHLHGGVQVTAQVQGPQGFTELGVDSIAPVFRRGVLLDVAGYRRSAVPLDDQIQSDELDEVAAAQGVEVRPGDVALVRTGNGRRWAEAEAYLRGCGMARSASEWMVSRGLFAVGADLVAWDLPGVRDPELGTTLPGHLLLLVRAGIHIVENLYLEELAADGVREFLFVCLPLKYTGATGSPVRPVAVVPA
jgi:kynurenine formamidase